jgi:putative aldouronate transport system substrate-binding protein
MDQNRLANGKVYMVPASFINLTVNALAISIREDLRKEYGVPEVTDVASLETYFDAVKANSPGVWPYAATQNNNELKTVLYRVPNNIITVLGNPLEDFYEFKYTKDMTPEQAAAALRYVGDSPEYKDYAKLMKTWADKGFWSRSAIADTTLPRDSYENGQSAMFVQNTGTMGMANNTLRDKGYEPKMIDMYPKAIRAMGATSSGVAIPHSSENVGRALMFLDLLKYDANVYELYRWGIEGKHWEWVNKDLRIWKHGPDQSQYVYGQGSWGFSSPEFEPRDMEGADVESVTIFRSWWADDVQVANPLAGLNIDQTPIQNEIAALTNVRAQYLYLIDLGLVKDVDKEIENMNAAAKAAGLDKVTEEIQRQISVWLTTH